MQAKSRLFENKVDFASFARVLSAVAPTISCEAFGKVAAIVESGPDNPIGTLQGFCQRKITKANRQAQALGIEEGMIAKDTFELVA